LWRGTRPTGRVNADAGAAYLAVEVPEALILRKRLRMPDMPQIAMAQAAALEVAAANPFAPDDFVWQWHVAPVVVGGARTIEVVLASRRQVAQFLHAQQAQLPQAAAIVEPEAWSFASDGAPLVFAGWGEERRLRHMARQRRLGYVMVATAFLLLVAMALTPSLQLRTRSLQAIAAFDGLQRQAAPAVGQREAFTRSVERLEALRSVLSGRIDMLKLMTALTKVLPDDTYLQSVQTQDMKATIHGLTADSASLMQKLSAVPGFKEVRAPMAATRAPGADAENFRLEVQLDPAVFALASGDAEATQQTPDGGVAPMATQQPAPASAEPAAPANATPARKSRFTSGG